MKFAVEAWPFVLPFGVAAAAAAWLRSPVWTAVAAVAGLCVLLFFRIPTRHGPADPDVVIAPANGVVTSIERVREPAIDDEAWRIVTFLSVFDVHVQRSPVTGKVMASELTPGRKVAAFRGDAGEVNESHFVVLERPDGDRIGVRQIAGLLARRVVSYLEAGDEIERGELIGLIKFGSRVDLLLPADYEVVVSKGARLREGETIVARR